MLRFITYSPNTSTMTAHISIHLMLRFISYLCTDNDLSGSFQYISCYGLSYRLDVNESAETDFNTSHVTVYRLASNAIPLVVVDFNTSHVTVYHKQNDRGMLIGKISIHLMLRFIKIADDKLDHKIKFQYISCYGLSSVSFSVSIKSRLFQYISCYGLSILVNKFCLFLGDFNTSHVTVYHTTDKHVFVWRYYFNTSHVTVYQ